MLDRTPPSDTRAHFPRSIMAFDKRSGTKGSTFYGRVIQRIVIRVNRGNGQIVRCVRFGGRYWPIYEPDTFAENSPKWVNDGDIVYGPGPFPLKLPLEHPYLFDSDRTLGIYW